MQIGFAGLGAVVHTAYLPALQRLGRADTLCYGFDPDPARAPTGIQRCTSLEGLLAQSLDILFITTSSTSHLPVLQQALASPVPRICVEKPVVASLAQMSQLNQLLGDPAHARRVLALDHWMVRNSWLAPNAVNPAWQAQDGQDARLPLALADISRIEGFLQEPSGLNAAGEPIALNFATGEPDTRQLQHPDGVILDTGTHVLALLREIIHHLGGEDTLQLHLTHCKDRLGRPIVRTDLVTAEGEAHLQGRLGGITTDIWLNKYAGAAGGQKGFALHLRDGRVIRLNRQGNADVLSVSHGAQTQQWSLPGPIYDHCLGAVLNPAGPFTQAAALTRRRMAEVTLLLQIQQLLRGPH
ncbi:putative dehydrogenase [Silvimonas terrae]|uniref:Putative dehydrogenase n=1 Tax=Silvimonas terrae TaxID=300266 RepID=A0A840RHC5_9NEIS|nr:Gfo/Idh/MocA family oxidoreductase [Silvimonas terrae]MBB5191673.1 putative dehydrogenase [Silvimonas terrae]